MCPKDQKGSPGAPLTPSVDFPAPPFSKPSIEKSSLPKGFRKDYKIGETLRTPSHMIVEPTDEQACRAADSLDNHDFAFVRRSDGSFSYAIMAYRSVEPPERGNQKSTEECMTFAMSGVGSTKKVRKKHWGKYVRLVSMDGLVGHPPIGMISFDPQMNDDHSIISSVSDRARASSRRQVHYGNDAA